MNLENQMSDIVKYNLLFKVLRKSSMLKELEQNDSTRKVIMNLKYAIASLDPHMYNLIKMMSTDPERFTIERINETEKTFLNYTNITYSHDKKEIITLRGKEVVTRSEQHFALVDNKTRKVFYYVNRNVYYDGKALFSNEDAAAFECAKFCVLELHERLSTTKEKMKIEQLKQDIFSDYE